MDNEKELQSRIDEWIKAHEEDMVRDSIELTKIKSVSVKGEGGYPYGTGCAKVLDKALSMAEGMGFETENDDYYCGVAYLRGNTDKEIGMFGHLDVVPEGDLKNWDFDPYDAHFKDGYVLGRGSSDNKCPAIASLYSLKCIKDLGIKLDHTVFMYFGCDEEAGMSDVVHFLSHHKAPEFSFTSDGRYSLCYGEKGILTAKLVTDVTGSDIISMEGGQASNMVPDHCEAVIKCTDIAKLKAELPEDIEVADAGEGRAKVSANGIAAHAAFPEGSISAIQKLAAALYKTDMLDDKSRKVMGLLSEGFKDHYGTGLGIAFEDEIVGKTTAVGGAVSVKDGKLVQLLNVRYALKTDRDAMKKALKETCGSFSFSVEDLSDDPPMYVSLDDPCVKILHETANEFLDGTYVPYVMGGGTYARKIPHAVAYGPTTRKIDATDPLKYGEGHQPNEGMKLSDMTTGVRIYVNALLRLDKELSKENN